MDPSASSPPTSVEPEKRKFTHRFFDEQDGKFDFSNILAKGGFLPVPIVITEPAVDGGFGVAAAFLSSTPGHPKQVTRHILAAFKTGNGSDGVGYFQSGHAMDGRLSYRFGLGHGKVTLEHFSSVAPGGIDYTSHYDYGLIGSALWSLGPDSRFSIGPLFDFRKLTSKVDIEGLPDEFAGEFNQKMQTGALGLGFHYDGRDNPLTPTSGLNAFVEGKANSEAFGSDRDYQVYDAAAYGFRKLSPKLRGAIKLEYNGIRNDFPVYYAPAINLRGVSAARYQGMDVYDTETEVTWQASPRWSLLAFGGVGAAEAGSSRIYEDSGAIWAGGVGFRYRIARKFGLDAGLDVAYGPDGGVFYIQFGHAWAMRMD